MLDRKIRYRSLPEAIRDEFLWQSRVDRDRRHARQDDDDGADRLAADGGRPRSERARRRHRASTSTAATGSAPGRDFVIEGDEYDSAFFDKTAKFLKYLPDIAVVGNLEYDHADIYAGHGGAADGVPAVRRRSCRGTGWLILGADSPEAARLAASRAVDGRDVRRSSADADWRASDDRADGERMRVRRDASAASASASSRCRCTARTTCGTRWRRWRSAARRACRRTSMRRALAEFRGVRRRLELRGVARGVSVFDDFAHHPTAILETLDAVRCVAPGPTRSGRCSSRGRRRRAGACFRTTSRARSSSPAPTRSILAPVFRSSLPEAERLSVDELVARRQQGRPPARCTARRRRPSSRRSRARRAPAISSSSCRTAGSTASTTSCWTRWRRERVE